MKRTINISLKEIPITAFTRKRFILVAFFSLVYSSRNSLIFFIRIFYDIRSFHLKIIKPVESVVLCNFFFRSFCHRMVVFIHNVNAHHLSQEYN